MATQEYVNAPLDGDFTAEGLPEMRWSLTSEPGQVESLLNLRITLTSGGGQELVVLDQLAFAPATTTEATN